MPGTMNQYTDLFVDFDDTLYDTHGNSVIALQETFEHFQLGRYFPDPQVFYDSYWEANIDLWTRYSKGEIDRDFLIVERFRRPLMASQKFEAESHLNPEQNSPIPADAPTHCLSCSLSCLLEMNDVFLGYCSSKPGVVDGAHELVDYLQRKGFRLHMCSNGFHEVQYKKLAASGLSDAFETVVLSEDAGANKPSKQFFDYAFRVTGAKPETTLMIGDNYNTDILGAQQAGLAVIFFNRFPEYPAPAPVDYEVTSLCDIMKIL
jgi:putative hydrolase of the HAD superfamily